MITIFDSEKTVNGTPRKRVYYKYPDSVELRRLAKKQALMDMRNEI